MGDGGRARLEKTVCLSRFISRFLVDWSVVLRLLGLGTREQHLLCRSAQPRCIQRAHPWCSRSI